MANLKLSMLLELKDKISNPLSRTQQKLVDLNSTVNKLKGFSKLTGETRAAKKSLQEHQTATASLARKIREAKNPSAALRKEFNASIQASKNAKSAYTAKSQELAKMRAQMRAAGLATRNLTQEQTRLNAQINRLKGRQAFMSGLAGGGKGFAGGISKGFGGIVKGLGWIGLAIAGAKQLGSAVSGLVGPFIEASATFEKYRIMLEGIEGSGAKAKESMSWIENFARQTPMDVDGVTQAFIKMRTLGLNPTDGSLQSLVDMNARMGGSADNLQGMILALGQAWTKGKLQGEEAMQLLERGVPVWDLMSKVTGKSAAELQELSAKGWLGREAIAALIEEMGAMSKGAAQSQMKSFDGMVSNLGDHWDGFKRKVMDSGPFQMIKDKLGGLLSKLDEMAQSGELQQWADKVGQGMIKTFDAIEVGFNVAVGAARFFGAVLEGLLAIGEALYWPFKKLGELINTI